MWHRIAPRPRRTFHRCRHRPARVRRQRDAPSSAERHAPYSMRALAVDQVEACRRWGTIGSRWSATIVARAVPTAWRWTTQAVDRVAVLDIVPTGHAFSHADQGLRARLLGVVVPRGARVRSPRSSLGALRRSLVEPHARRLVGRTGSFPARYGRRTCEQFRDPRRRHAICEQYRAAGTLDVEHDNADRGRVRITSRCWRCGARVGRSSNWYDPLEVWRSGPTRSRAGR